MNPSAGKTGYRILLAFALPACSGGAFISAGVPSGLEVFPAETSDLPTESGVSDSGTAEGGSSAADAPAVESSEAVDRDAQFVDAGLNAVDAADAADAAVCLQDLSGVGQADFSVSFVVEGAAGGGPLLEQRATCGQYDPQWYAFELPTGHLATYFYDGAGGFQLQSVSVLSDGAPHRVTLARSSLVFSISVDGQLDTSVPRAGWAPAALPLLEVGRSPCTPAFAGTISAACVSKS